MKETLAESWFRLTGYLTSGLVGIAFHAMRDTPWWVDMIWWTVLLVTTWAVLDLIGWLWGRWQRRRNHG